MKTMKWTVVALALLAALVFRLAPLVFADQEWRRPSVAARPAPVTVPLDRILER